MHKILKRTRLTLAVVLTVQAITLFFLFILQVAKRRSLAQAFLAVAAFEGTAGGYLFWQLAEEEKERKQTEAQVQAMMENPTDFTIPLDKKASEREFR